jgi:hypothetical protein
VALDELCFFLKSPASSITSPPSKLSNITKYLKSPRRGEKAKQTKTKSKTKKSTRKGKSKDIESYVEDSSNVSGNTSKVGSSKTTAGESDASVMGNTSMATTCGQEQDLEQAGQTLKQGASSSPCETGDRDDHSSPGPAVKDSVIRSSLDPAEDRDVSSTSGQARGEDSGKRRMVQTNLSMSKDGIEVLSSPEQKTEKKKEKKGRKAR